MPPPLLIARLPILCPVVVRSLLPTALHCTALHYAALRGTPRTSRFCQNCRSLADRPDLLGPAGSRQSFDQAFHQTGTGNRGVYYRGRNKGAEGGMEADEDEEVADAAADDLVRIQRVLDHMDK